MSDTSKLPSLWGRVTAAIISVVVAGLLGMAVGARVDDLLQPTLGPTGATVAGFGSAFAVMMGLGLVSYRGLNPLIP